jgi:hypothetical protein
LVGLSLPRGLTTGERLIPGRSPEFSKTRLPEKDVEINPGKAGRFLTEPDNLQRGLYEVAVKRH